MECVGGEKANLGCHFPGVSVEEEGLLHPLSLKCAASRQDVVVTQIPFTCFIVTGRDLYIDMS